jgi:hypothetical protein
MLDAPGLMVEPDVRRKIAKYFKTMKLREVIEQMIDEMVEQVPIHDAPAPLLLKVKIMALEWKVLR